MTIRYADNFSGTQPFSDTCMNTLLAASTALPWTVPGTPNQIFRARFSFTISASVWVRLNATAVVPVSGVVAGTPYQEMLTTDFYKYVRGGDTLSFISTGTPQVGVSLMLVQEV